MHLTEDKIQAFRNEGKSMQTIADAIGCHQSTTPRELKRKTVIQRRSDLTEYEAFFRETGQAIYEKNRARCSAKYKLAQVADFIHFAVEKIQKNHWSPDAICGYVKMNQLFDDDEMVCTKTLYHYIDWGMLPIKSINLPLKVMRSTKKKRSRKNKKVLSKSIEDRPTHVDDRTEFGH